MCWFLGYLLSYNLNNGLNELMNDIPRATKLLGQQTFYQSFFSIWVANLSVALILSYVGYFTGGVATLLVSTWNGVLVGVSLHIFYTKVQTSHFSLLFQLFGHLPFEVVAFCWFGSFGLRGWQLVYSILKESDIELQLPNLKQVANPLICLTIAALFENILLYLNNLK